MKKIILAFIAVVAFLNVSNAQHDTMYVMKAGMVISQFNIYTQVDSIVFKRPTVSTFTDARDGNVYKMVTIGSQVWMAENLRYLPNVVGPATGSEFFGHNSDSYCYVYGYNGTSVASAKQNPNYAKYGVLYNWNAAMDGYSSSAANPSGKKGICPTGWHMPSNAEWTQLTNGFGGDDFAAHALLEIGTAHWNDPNNLSTNESGFTALPGGERSNIGDFFFVVGGSAYFWTSTAGDVGCYWRKQLVNNYPVVFSHGDADHYHGFSVRCVKD